MYSQRAFLIVFLLISFGVFPAAAQIDRASLNGTVTDPTGAVVPGVKVEAVLENAGKQREALTNNDGIYVLPALPIGAYNITFSRTGFETARYEDVELQVGQKLTLDVSLKLGSVSTQVEVKSTAPLLERTSAELAGVVQSTEIQNLPVNGRNWASLLMLAPGAIDDGGGDQRTIRFAGRGRDDNNYKLDGADATGIQEQAQKSTTRLQVSEDAVEEYRVNTMLYTAEYGGGAGGQVDLVTKSGSNQLHGSAFEYFRNSALDSRSFLDLDLDPAQTGPTKNPPFRLNQFGGSLGGPIVKDRTFFFIDYEGLRQFRAQTLHAFVPSAAFRLSADPRMAPILAAYPLGTLPVDADTTEFTRQGAVTLREDSALIRLDHKFSERTTLYIRANRDISKSFAPLNNLFDVQAITTNPANYVIALQHAFSSTVFNEAKFGLNRSPYHNPQICAFPFAVNSDNFEGLNNCNTDNEVGTTFAGIDNLTITRGRHTFKTGGEFRRIRLNQGITADPTLDFTTNDSVRFDQLSDFLVRETWWSRGYRRFWVMPYFQDEWKLRPNFTLNMGLRWEYYSVMKEVHDRLTVFDFERCHGICPAGSPTEFPNYRNFDPRVSLAWSPRRFSDKTVIRAGFGIYSGSGQNDDANAAFESNTNRLQLTSSDVPNLSYPIDQYICAGCKATSFQAPRALQRDRRDLYASEWGLSVQQALPDDFVFQAGYLGSEGARLFARTVLNVCADSTNMAGNCTRPLSGFSSIDLKRNDGNSSFNGLQVSLQRHFTRGWLWETQYMWSHSINDGSVGGGEANAPENVACRRCDRGPSVFDVRHNLVVTSVYDLPFGPKGQYWKASGFAGKLLEGWSLSTLGVWHTGHPLTIIAGRDPSVIPDGNDRSDERVDVVPGVNQTFFGSLSGGLWINPAAFAVPRDFTFGNAGRGLVRAPTIWEMDLGLTKKIALTERFNLEFRTEAFNVFNHNQLGDPNVDLLGSNFGLITTTVNFNANNDNLAPPNTGTGVPRQIEFSLRLTF